MAPTLLPSCQHLGGSKSNPDQLGADEAFIPLNHPVRIKERIVKAAVDPCASSGILYSIEVQQIDRNSIEVSIQTNSIEVQQRLLVDMCSKQGDSINFKSETKCTVAENLQLVRF